MEVDGSNGSFHGSVVEASIVGGGVEASTTVLSSTEVHDHIRCILHKLYKVPYITPIGIHRLSLTSTRFVNFY